MRYDAVVVIGSGFLNADSDELSTSALRRFEAAARAVEDRRAQFVILTGFTIHPEKGTVFGLKLKMLAFQRLGEWKVYFELPPEFRNEEIYPRTTNADIDFALRIAREEEFKSLLVVSEAPHLFFRVMPRFRKLAPDMKLKALPIPAPWWFWPKEALSWLALALAGGNDKGRVYQAWRTFWKKRLAPHAGLYEINIPKD